MPEAKLNANVTYPYLPEGATIAYVGMDHPAMQEAKQFAHDHSLDSAMPTGSAVVKDGQIIGRGANGSDYHKTHTCRRVELNIPTGQGYELCEGCHPKNHSETRAIEDAKKHTASLEGAELYLWGHWWCCEPCWNAMLTNGIKTAYLLENSQVLFNKLADGNVVGRQFELA